MIESESHGSLTADARCRKADNPDFDGENYERERVRAG
jgi:hypothetical protein